jgi:hypothetical protein
MQIVIDLLLLCFIFGWNQWTFMSYCLMGWTLTSRRDPRQIARPISNFPKSQHGIRSFFSINENLAYSRQCTSCKVMFVPLNINHIKGINSLSKTLIW